MHEINFANDFFLNVNMKKFMKQQIYNIIKLINTAYEINLRLVNYKALLKELINEINHVEN